MFFRGKETVSECVVIYLLRASLLVDICFLVLTDLRNQENRVTPNFWQYAIMTQEAVEKLTFVKARQMYVAMLYHFERLPVQLYARTDRQFLKR